jgi:hypothetical protein
MRKTRTPITSWMRFAVAIQQTGNHEHSKRDDTGRTADGTRQERPKRYQAATMMMMMISDDRNDGESFPVDAP